MVPGIGPQSAQAIYEFAVAQRKPNLTTQLLDSHTAQLIIEREVQGFRGRNCDFGASAVQSMSTQTRDALTGSVEIEELGKLFESELASQFAR